MPAHKSRLMLPTLLLLLLCACGQKGELYLPDSTPTVDTSDYDKDAVNNTDY